MWYRHRFTVAGVVILDCIAATANLVLAVQDTSVAASIAHAITAMALIVMAVILLIVVWKVAA